MTEEWKQMDWVIDIGVAEELLQRDDSHADILQPIGIDLLAEVKRLQQLIVDAAWQIHWVETTTAAHMESIEWDENIHAPAQAWRKQVQEILDASEEGCPWKESEEE